MNCAERWSAKVLLIKSVKCPIKNHFHINGFLLSLALKQRLGETRKFTIFTLPIVRLVYPQKFCLSIVSKFSWEDCKSREKLETILMQNCWGVNKAYYGNVNRTRSRIDWLKPMSRGISGGKQVIKFASTSNRGRVCLFYHNETTTS